MPQDHVGALSGVAYVIPELDDEADVEVAFAAFADSIPGAPKALTYVGVTANVDPAVINHMYINEGTGPITITLPAGAEDGDKIVGYQLGNTGSEVTLVGGAGVSYQGPQATTGQYTAVTAVWHNGKWVGSPFSFSGDRPTASTGGEVIDLNGRRYHVFKTPGAFTFMSHQNQNLTVTLFGGGGDGVEGVVGDSGEGGYGGEVLLQQPYVAFGLDYIAVIVPDAGETAQFGTLTAAGGSDGIPGTPTPAGPPTVVSGDLAAALGAANIGGDGGNAVGPVDGTFGKGGGGGFDMKADITRPSHVESGTNPRYWVVTRPAWTETVQTGTTTVHHVGDPCVGGQCPGGWYCAPYGSSYPVDMRCQTDTQEPVYGTVNHPEEGYWAGGESWSHTVWDACPSGYVVGGSGTICVDSRSSGAGRGGIGGVVVSYVL